MPRYADKTTVPMDRSIAELQGLVRRYGATEFAQAWNEREARVGFKMQTRHVLFSLPFPDASEFWRTPTGRARTGDKIRAEHEQAIRQRWRALVLVVKAKLEAVDSGITTFDQEFMAHIVIPGTATTIGDRVLPALEANDVPLLESFGSRLDGER